MHKRKTRKRPQPNSLVWLLLAAVFSFVGYLLVLEIAKQAGGPGKYTGGAVLSICGFFTEYYFFHVRGARRKLSGIIFLGAGVLIGAQVKPLAAACGAFACGFMLQLSLWRGIRRKRRRWILRDDLWRLREIARKGTGYAGFGGLQALQDLPAIFARKKKPAWAGFIYCFALRRW